MLTHLISWAAALAAAGVGWWLLRDDDRPAQAGRLHDPSDTYPRGEHLTWGRDQDGDLLLCTDAAGLVTAVELDPWEGLASYTVAWPN